MRSTAFLLTFAFLLPFAGACDRGADMTETPTDIRSILDTQARRFQAMVANDLDTLDDLLSPDLVYTHTTGRVESKEEFLAQLTSKRIKYMSLEPSDVVVRVFDGTAVVTGTAAVEVHVGGRDTSFDIRFIEVYHAGEDAWRLVAWQSTRLP